MPLGMESGEIRDSDITASSSYENGNVGPHIGRIRTENFGGKYYIFDGKVLPNTS